MDIDTIGSLGIIRTWSMILEDDVLKNMEMDMGGASDALADDFEKVLAIAHSIRVNADSLWEKV